MIREATLEDIPDILEIHKYLVEKLSKLHPHRFVLRENEDINFSEEIKKYIEQDDRCVFVYEKDGKVVGYGNGRTDKSISYEVHRQHGWISEIAVIEEMQNKGIGGEIIDSISDFFKSKGLKVVYFFTELENRQSMNAWEKRGFKKETVMFYKEI